MMPSWAVYLALAVGVITGFGSYWVAEWLSPRESRCVRCGVVTPPGVDLCWECAEMDGRRG